MRRASALLIVPLLAAVAFVAGCGSSSPKPSNGASPSVTVSGPFGSAPKVNIPAAAAGPSLYTKTLIQGSGAPLTSTEAFEGKSVAFLWSGKTHKQEGNYTDSLFANPLMPGLATALKGAKVGSRVLAVIPAKTAFGSQGDAQLGIKPTDTLVFVVDVDKKIANSATGKQVSSGGGALPKVSSPPAGTAPTVTIPTSAPPKNLTSTTLIKGAGPKVSSGQLVLVQYTGVNWRTGKVFDSSYSRHEPMEAVLITNPQQQGSVIPGWVKGLSGQTVGSRVLLTIPPSQGFGSTGSSQAGIKGTDTIVFSVDILAAAQS
ncbi:MAG: FKBP-type peptidyl-prolyl cis-trans isomerase [Nocardiopsaceae bacterium]|nr:FKBP-type peptidyl-prolyl cis-trans isomerase [Nocardiopsaceae bacterium]